MGLIAGDTSGRIGKTIDNTLIIRDVNTADQGRYTCKASNANGDATNTTFVKVISKIIIFSLPFDLLAHLSRRLTR